MNLNEIIERKKEEFEKTMTCIDECKNGLYEDIGCPAHGEDAIKTKRFLEKAIRESVEEALREVKPEKDEDFVYCEHKLMAGDECTCGKGLHTLFDVRVKEFMQ